MDPYRPDSWHDFFIATAGAAAALTGLLFVALSIHIQHIGGNPLPRNQARGSLIGLVQTLVVSLVVLARQPAAWAGWELVAIGVFYLVVIGWYQVAVFNRMAWKIPRLTFVRSSFGYLLAIIGIVGGIGIVTESGPGLYAAAFISIAIVIWNLRNAWFLLMGVADEYLVHPKS